MKMKKLSEDHYIVMDDSEIKEGDWIYNAEREPSILKCVGKGSLRGWQKITHSTFSSVIDLYRPNTPLILNLSEVKELLGEVDVEMKAKQRWGNVHRTGVLGYIEGYKQALEDNKEKKYTEEDMQWALHEARYHQQHNIEEIIEALHQPKTEWEMEFINGKLQLVKE